MSSIVFVLNLLKDKYTEHYRCYHSLSHPVSMLETAKEMGIVLTPEQEHAIWFHDVIYRIPSDLPVVHEPAECVDGTYKCMLCGEEDSGVGACSLPVMSNEKLSAVVAVRALKDTGFSDDYCDEVSAIIEDTENHIPTCEGSAVVIDLDLYGLASDYWQNKHKVETEVSLAMGDAYDEDEFNRKRALFLRSFLERDKIFVSGRFDHLEQKARENLETDLWIIEEFAK